MFLGLFFFIRQGWKQDKRYILWNILYQLVNAPLPVVAALLPKLIIDELMGAKDVAKILTYTALFTGYTLIATALSAYFFNDGFTRRCRVAAEFDSELHRRLCMCDYGNLENPKFLEMPKSCSTAIGMASGIFWTARFKLPVISSPCLESVRFWRPWSFGWFCCSLCWLPLVR